MPSFTHLHVHSQYSLLEGAMKLDALCAQSKKLGMDAVALTDSGNMFGAYEFHKKAARHDIKPIFGAEVYYLTDGPLTSRDVKRKDQFLANLILLVQNETGYRNLCKLLSLAHLKGFYYKPRVDKEVLEKYSEGLIALSGTVHGELHRRLLNEEKDLAVKAANFLTKIFPNRFYVELQDHGLPLEKKIWDSVLKLCSELQLPYVATNDCKYLKQDDAEAQLVLTCIQKGWTLNEAEDRIGSRSDQQYLKSPQEMAKHFKDLPEAIANTQKIVEQCNFDFKNKVYHFPKFDPPQGLTLEESLEQMAQEGLKEHWPRILKNRDRNSSEGLRHPRAGGDDDSGLLKIYQKRLKHELKIINQMGFAGYFLIVADFINFAKTQGIPVGPGRGSAAGSLVAYCLKITDVDPMPYDLLFERFLNPERISMPDMDIDFCIQGRDRVIQYVAEKYGHVAQIITFGTMKAKAVIRDVGRVLDMPYGEVDKIAKLVPNALNITLEEALKQEPRLKDLEKQDKQVKRLLSIARRLEGVNRHASMHAAGVVIGDKPLTDFCPLYRGPNEEVITQFDMGSVENVGLIKFDFLGLKTLTVIHHAFKLIEETKGIKLQTESIPLNDSEVFKNLSRGDGLGLFQLESSGMRDVLTQIKPTCFEDIIALIALYRPGPMQMIGDFANRKHGKTPITYELDQLAPILENTYGIIVYQEQVMQIASSLGGFSLGDADLLRRAMGKKKKEEMKKQKEKFLTGAKAGGIAQAKAKKIFELMEKFAEYGFNKSHSAAYALVSYYTAYLKTRYPVEYFASLLTFEMSNTDKILLYINDAREHNIKMLPPDINESQRDFSVVGDKEIRFGLAAVKGVGDAAIASILEERQRDGVFKDFFDFCTRVDLRRVNKKVIESLIKCGALVSLNPNRAQTLAGLDTAMDWGVKRRADSTSGQTSMFDLLTGNDATPQFPQVTEWSEAESLAQEKQALGFYITGHPLTRYSEQIKRLASFNTNTLTQAIDKSEVTLCGMVASLKEIRTKRGKRMAFVNLEDQVGNVEVIVFNELYEKSINVLQSESPLYVKGEVDKADESAKILAREILPLEEMKRRKTQSVHLRVDHGVMDTKAFQELKSILSKHPGRLPTYLHLVKARQEITVLSLPPDLQVELSDDFITEVEGLFGREAVILN